MTYHVRLYYNDSRGSKWCDMTFAPTNDLNEAYQYRANKALDFPEYEYVVEEYK